MGINKPKQIIDFNLHKVACALVTSFVKRFNGCICNHTICHITMRLEQIALALWPENIKKIHNKLYYKNFKASKKIANCIFDICKGDWEQILRIYKINLNFYYQPIKNQKFMKLPMLMVSYVLSHISSYQIALSAKKMAFSLTRNIERSCI